MARTWSLGRTNVAEMLGPYELRGELGRGAMATVWRAFDPKIERLVAVKEPIVPHGIDSATAAEMGARFVREGKAAGQLNHPNIVTIYNAEIYAGRPAIVMELLEGQTLGEIIDAGRLSTDAAINIIDQLLDAVGYAHSRGVVHRDIKPDNVFITSDGRVKLTDFGIASLNAGGTLTQAGTVLGTPGYMSPEQVVGSPADGRADIFAVGVIAYELLTGHNPFGATDGSPPTTILYRVVHEQPPELGALDSALPPHLAQIVSRAMAKDPAQRYQTAEEMRADLRGSSFSAAPVGMPVPGRKAAASRTWMAIAAAAAIVLIVLAIVFSGTGSRSGGAAGALSIAVASPAAGYSASVGDSVPLRFTAPNATRVVVYVNGTQLAALSAPFEVQYTAAKEGDYTIRAVAEGPGGPTEATQKFSVASASGGSSAPSSPAPSAADAESGARKAVGDWLTAWNRMDFGTYISFYAPDFHADYKGSDGVSLDAWRAYKGEIFASYSYQKITTSRIQVSVESPDRVRAEFMQDFKSDSVKGKGTYHDYGRKTMVLTRQGDDRWLISQEEWYKQ
jgi:ketosteroid isomerase-like protein